MKLKAVGKWVNDKGIPEAEKIVQISNIFDVSLDYLLKENIEKKSNSNKKYYVSKELLDKYLLYNRKRTTQIAFGIALILLSNAFNSLEYNNSIKSISYWLTFITGLAIVIIYFFQTKQYQEIKNNEIVVDKHILEEFRREKEFRRKKYVTVIIVSIIILLLSSECYSLKKFFSTEFCIFLACILNAISITTFIWSCISIYVDNTIVKNTENRTKSKKERYAWVYTALPITIVAVIIGIFTNAWSPYAPIIISVIVIFLLAFGILSSVFQENDYLNNTGNNNLSKIEIYSALNNELIKSIDNEKILSDYNKLFFYEHYEENQEKLKENIQKQKEQYKLVAYKFPVSQIGNKDLEENFTITLYENSNIIKMTVSSESVKNFSLPQEFLTFYYSTSNEELQFLNSLIN